MASNSWLNNPSANRTALRFARCYLKRLISSDRLFEIENDSASSLTSLNADWYQIERVQNICRTTDQPAWLEIREQFQKAFMILSYKLGYEEHLQWTKMGLDAAQKLNHPHQTVMHLQTLATISYKHQQYRQVIEYADQTLNYIKAHKLPVGVADIWLYRSMAKSAMKQPALDEYQSVLTIAQTENAQIVLIQAHVGIAHEHLDQNNVDEARHHYQAANKIAKHNSALYWQAQTCLHLGNLDRTTGHFDEALTVFNEGLNIAAKSGDWLTKRHLLASIGDLYREKMDYEKAKEFYRQAVILSAQVADTIGIITFSVTLANLALQTGDTAESQSLIEDMIQLAKTKNITFKLGELYQLLGNILMSAKSWQPALESLRTAQKFYQEMGLDYDLEEVASHIQLIEVYVHAQEFINQLADTRE